MSDHSAPHGGRHEAAVIEHALGALAASALDPLFLRPQRLGVESGWYGHIPFAHWLAASARPHVFVELGSHYGVSYFAFCEAFAQFGVDVRAYAVDSWQGDAHAGFYGDDVYWDVRRFHDERFGGFSELLRCTFAEALPYFEDGTVDLLHIDGFHSYDAVRADWEAWRPKLSEHGVVLFHDINVRERGFGVWRLWSELRQRHPGFDFLHEHGLGVLAVGPCPPEPVRALCSIRSARDIAAVRDRFALLGERWRGVAERDAAIGRQQRAEAALAGKTAELAAAQDEAAALVGRLAGAERQAKEHARAAAESMAREREAVRADAAALQRRLTEAEAARERDHAAVTTLRVQLITAEQRADEGEAERHRLAAVSLELAALRRHHHVLVSSTGWQVASLLNRAEARFPRTTRTLARAMRLGGLALTGRLPAHLRLRRQNRDDAEVLRSSRLFDAAAYRSRYPDVAQSGIDPLWHYIWTGAAAGYDPHPLFDTRWYLAQHPGLARASANPLSHYIRHGATQGDDPHPLFDTSWYVAQEPEAAGNALLHYLDVGAGRGRQPNPFFDTTGYWEEYLRDTPEPDEPLSHYVLRGAAAGNDPHALFDTDWYAATYPDCAGHHPLAHFLRVGRARGDAPCLVVQHANCSVEDLPPLRFAYHRAPQVSIIIPVYGRIFDTLRCLYAIMLQTRDVVYEVIVADDRPAASIAPRLRTVPGLRVEQNECNLGFLRTCMTASRTASGRHFLFLNNDTTAHPGWLKPMVALAEGDPRVGMVGGKLLNADGTVQEAGGIMRSDGWGEPYGRGDDADLPQYNWVREVDVVIGACFMVRAAAWTAVGGFDDAYAPAYYEEFDLAFMLRAQGWRVMYQPASVVTHFDASSYGLEQRARHSVRNHSRFCEKWGAILAAQPARDVPAFLARQRPVAGQRILVVDDRVPEPDRHAGSMVTLHWLRLMREAGMAITFAPHDRDRPEPYTRVLQDMGIEVLYGAVDPAAWLAENGRHLDHVWVARPEVAAPLLEACDRYAPGRLIYYTHDLHFLREERRYTLSGDPAHLSESRRLRRLETEAARHSRLVLTPSRDEVPVIRGLAPSADVRAVPLYSVPSAPLHHRDPAEFGPLKRVVFVGGYRHPPNIDAALWLAQDIMPIVRAARPDAECQLVGSDPPAEVEALSGSGVEVAGWVPDLGPVYAAARVSIAPVRYGAGVKGKILGALQAGVPIVTTPIGNEGLGLRHGDEALIGETADELAAHVLALLGDPALCARLADAGTAVLRQRFGEDAARRVLGSVLGVDICPCCGRRTDSPVPVAVCSACGAGEPERSLAEAAIRPFRRLSIASLAEAAPLLAGSAVRLPDGPLRRAGIAESTSADLDLIVTMRTRLEGCAVRPGGRWLSPAGDTPEDVAAALSRDGWTVWLHESGTPVLEAERA